MFNKKIFSIFNIFGFLLGVLFSSINFNNIKPVSADNVVDVGTLTINRIESPQQSHEKGVFVLSSNANDIPVNSWKTKLISNEPESVIYNGKDLYSEQGIKIAIVKHSVYSYYIALGDAGFVTRSKDDTVTIKGNWTTTVEDTTYTVFIERFTVIWDGEKWYFPFQTPELEAYDKISLTQVAIDDIDRVAFNNETTNSAWNHYIPSTNNTTHSFTFEFLYEAYYIMKDSLSIRVGTSSTWDTGNFYRFTLNNSWGTSPKNVVTLREITNGDINHPTFSSGDLHCDLGVGKRHKIEFGAIRVKNDNQKVYIFVKHDDSYILQTVITSGFSELTTRVTLWSSDDSFFMGSTIPQVENVDTFTFVRGNESKGIYLDAAANDIPVLDNWKTRAITVSKYNFLKNGSPAKKLDANTREMLVKFAEGHYYFSLADCYVTVEEGDIISLDGEFHFYLSGEMYLMTMLPISFIYENDEFKLFDLDTYLINELNKYINLDFYDETYKGVVEDILSTATSEISLAKRNKIKWDTLVEAKKQIDEIPLNEEEAERILKEAREDAIAEIESYVSSDYYFDEQLIEVRAIADEYIAKINASTSLKEIRDYVDEFKDAIKDIYSKQSYIENQILIGADGYEKYLSTYETTTTTDLCSTGELKFYSKTSQNESYNSNVENSVYSHYATKAGNETGGNVFQFLYKSSDPTSNKYGAQIFIRLRGTSNCYRFEIATVSNGKSGVALSTNVNGVSKNREFYETNFSANTQYLIEIGSIDLKNYDRTFNFIKVDGKFVIKQIADTANNASPLIYITDSYLADSSTGYASMSPVEFGTSKNENAIEVGCPVLVVGSSAESLKFELADNDLPLGTELYPAETGAFTYNGEDINAYKNNIRIIKIDTNTYKVNLKGIQINDLDTIHVGGCFATYNSTTKIKTNYHFSERDFIYKSSTDSWLESASILDALKMDAIKTLESYKDNLNNYSQENQKQIIDIINDYIERINNAISDNEIQELLDQAINAINAIEPSIDDLSTQKETAKNEIDAFLSKVDLSHYSEEEKDNIQKLFTQAKESVDNAKSEDEIRQIVESLKQKVKASKTNDGTIFDGEKYITKTEGNNSWVLFIIIPVSVVLIIATVVAILLLKKKKTK